MQSISLESHFISQTPSILSTTLQVLFVAKSFSEKNKVFAVWTRDRSVHNTYFFLKANIINLFYHHTRAKWFSQVPTILGGTTRAEFFGSFGKLFRIVIDLFFEF